MATHSLYSLPRHSIAEELAVAVHVTTESWTRLMIEYACKACREIVRKATWGLQGWGPNLIGLWPFKKRLRRDFLFFLQPL